MDLNKTTTPEEEKDLAQTPFWFVKALEFVIGHDFDLDVCALPRTAKVKRFYSLENGQDALELDWDSWNFCNPPYSDVSPWVEKAIIEAQKGRSSCLLIPNKPEVGYVRRCKKMADTIMEMPFRLNFLRPNGEPFLTPQGKKQGPKFPVMVALFTPFGLIASSRHEMIDFREFKVECEKRLEVAA